MKILILTPNLSTNCLGRAYILAQVLKRHFEVEIAGPMFSENIWEPLKDNKQIVFNSLGKGNFFRIYSKLRFLLKKDKFDVIYTSKPLSSSFGLALAVNLILKKPMVLDIDDWELGLSKFSYNKLSFLRKIKNFILFPFSYFNFWNIFFIEKLVSFVKIKTVSNCFLKDRFHGVIVPHGRDTEFMDPDKINSEKAKEELGLKDRVVVSYMGTARLHKGIEDLVGAFSLIKNDKAILLIAGLDSCQDAEALLVEKKLTKDKFKLLLKQPFENVRKIIAASDIVVIPQKNNCATIGQMPAKIYDGMCMAKPVISTKVNDIPDTLKQAGFVVEPEDINAMAEKISLLIEDRDLAKKLGQQGRKKCIEQYSYDYMEKVLLEIFNKFKED